MRSLGRVPSDLIAWIEPHDHEFVAAFVATKTADLRSPATRMCGSLAEARCWIKAEADAIGATVEWLEN